MDILGIYYGLQGEFGTAIVNEAWVFEPLKFGCMFERSKGFSANSDDLAQTAPQDLRFLKMQRKFSTCTFNHLTSDKNIST